MNKLYKYAALLAVPAALMTASSCTDLSETLYDQVASSNYYNTKDDVIRAVLRPFEHGFWSIQSRHVLNEETAPTVLGAFRNALAELDEITPDVVKATIKAVMKETALKGKFVFMPIRVALTGQMHGPDLNNIVTLLGKEKCLHRLDNVSALTK